MIGIGGAAWPVFSHIVYTFVFHESIILVPNINKHYNMHSLGEYEQVTYHDELVQGPVRRIVACRGPLKRLRRPLLRQPLSLCCLLLRQPLLLLESPLGILLLSL